MKREMSREHGWLILQASLRAFHRKTCALKWLLATVVLSSGFSLLLGFGVAVFSYVAQAATPPTITIINPNQLLTTPPAPIIAQCLNPTVQVYIAPQVTSPTDALPVATIFNNPNTALNPFPTNTDPDNYPLGTYNIVISACDHAKPPNCTNPNTTITLVVQDTLPPNIVSGQNKTVQCTSPLGAVASTTYCIDTCTATYASNANCIAPNNLASAGCQTLINNCLATCTSDGTVHLDKPAVVDLCDPNASFVLNNVPSSYYPLYDQNGKLNGNTWVNIIATDASGNVSNANVLVQVVDTVAPVFSSSVPSFNVISHAALNDSYTCSVNSQNGTWVTLPNPLATDTCTLSANINYSWYAAGVFAQTSSPTVCLPDGTTTVQFIALDGAGNNDTSTGHAATTANVTLSAAASFPLTLNVTGTSSGYVQSGYMNVQANNPNGTVTWTIVGASQPTSQTTTASSINTVFSSPGNFCPTYVSGVDASGKKGAVNPACFAIDTTVPSHTFTSIPTSNNPNTWPSSTTPTFSHGIPMTFALMAQDTNGVVQSGVANVTAQIISSSGTPTTIYSNTYCSNTTTSTLPTCPTSHYVSGCNQLGTPLCLCTALNSSTGDCSTSGRLDLSQLSNGGYTMQITVTDLAGNSETQSYPFLVNDMMNAFVGSTSNPIGGMVGMLNTAINGNSIPTIAVAYLNSAIAYLQGASAVFLESPGQAFLLAQQAFSQIDQARQNGFNSTTAYFYESYLSQLVQGEARRIMVAIQAQQKAGNLPLWPFLAADPNRAGVPLRGIYTTREFLVNKGNVFRDYVINPNKTLAVATSLLNLADSYTLSGQTAQAITQSILLYQSLAGMFQDSTMATLYGYSVHMVNVGGSSSNPNYIAEGYFQESPASHFGNEISYTVNAEIGRFTTLAQSGTLGSSGIVSSATITALQNVATKLQNFSAAVNAVQQSNWSIADSGFSNYKLVTQVYLNALGALQSLQALQAQSASIYTTHWQMAIALTLAQVLNFSMYEGPTALICVLWGLDSDTQGGTAFEGCSSLAASGAPKVYSSQGTVMTGHVIDWEAQVAECRYSLMMYAIADGRIANDTTNPNNLGAINLFTESECLIIDLYNRYYSGGKYLTADTVIDPTAYGCPATPATFAQADAWSACGACAIPGATAPCAPNGGCDTTCNGIDEDCNGLVDDNVVLTTCGCSGLSSIYICPCASSSACVSGHTLACVPGVPPSTVDVLCNDIDNNCNGQAAENYTPTTCGVGGCAQQSSCVSGVLNACVPKAATSEVCNGVDDNCNILVDEGLDQDHDGYGCTPGSPNCVQCVPGNANCTTALLCLHDKAANGNWTNVWDCNDHDPTIFPGNPEICDYKDNNCNGVIDEGVTNACGNCSPQCVTTNVGNANIAAPFTPTPNNAVSILQNANNHSLTLAAGGTISAPYAWITTDYYGTISKFNTQTGQEVARYCSAIQTGVTTFYNGQTSDSRAEPTVCGGCGGCNRPSRMAIDQSGNAYFANRAHTTPAMSTITAISGSLSTCVDVNGDGVIQTSSDVNGDGVIDPNQNLPSSKREYWGELDECILYTRKLNVWDQTAQPVCNTPGYVPNNNALLDPGNTNFVDEQAACLASKITAVDGGSSIGNICGWGNACIGNGNPNCTSYGTSAACTGNANNYCTWNTLCTGSGSCSSKVTQGTCQATSGCTWSQYCSAITCGNSNSLKVQCNSRPGCSFYQTCYNIAVGLDSNANVYTQLMRGLALDPYGYLWAGYYNGFSFVKVNPTNGKVRRSFYYQFMNEYGAVVDGRGILWIPNRCCVSGNLLSFNTNPNKTIKYINPDTNTVTWNWSPYQFINTAAMSPGPGSYGVAVDSQYHLWRGSRGDDNSIVYRYDMRRNTYSIVVANPALSGSGGSSGLGVDAAGVVWVAQPGGTNGNLGILGRLTGINTSTLAIVADVDISPVCNNPIGVDIGYGGTVWVNCNLPGSANNANIVLVVNPANPNNLTTFPMPAPAYTYSDFTGSSNRLFTAPVGTYNQIINACYGFPVQSWSNLVWQGMTPVGTANNGATTSVSALNFRLRLASALTTTNQLGQSVDPQLATTWSLWYPDDISNPNLNAADPNRVYYYTINPNSSQWPTTGVCANSNYTAMQSYFYNASTNSYTLQGCSSLSAIPTTYVFPGANANAQTVSYIQLQAQFVSDGDGTVQPTLNNFQVARSCPQFD